MSKHHHLPLIVGFLMMTVSAGAGQVNTASSQVIAAAGQIKTAKPGDPVERQLSGEQKFQAWSLDANVADDRNRWYRISAENVESLPEHMMLRRHVTTGAGPKGHPTA